MHLERELKERDFELTSWWKRGLHFSAKAFKLFTACPKKETGRYCGRKGRSNVLC